jgi:hypothetical protein
MTSPLPAGTHTLTGTQEHITQLLQATAMEGRLRGCTEAEMVDGGWSLVAQVTHRPTGEPGIRVLSRTDIIPVDRPVPAKLTRSGVSDLVPVAVGATAAGAVTAGAGFWALAQINWEVGAVLGAILCVLAGSAGGTAVGRAMSG